MTMAQQGHVNWALLKLEAGCRGFVKGLAENPRVISSFIHNNFDKCEERKRRRGARSGRSPSLPRETELARRRAERRRADEDVDEAPVTSQAEEEKPTDWKILWTMMLHNAVFSVICVLSVTHGFIPLLAYILGSLWTAVDLYISTILNACWLLPVYVLSKLYNMYWTTEYANLAYQRRRGRPADVKITFLLSDIFFTTFMELLLIVQVYIVGMMVNLNVRGFNVVDVVLTAISYALYAFEYKWLNMGIGCKKRLEVIDKNFMYYLGFGFPMALFVLFFHNFWLRFVLYSILFPFLVLMANEANEPLDTSGNGTTFVFFLPTKGTKYFLRFCAWLVYLVQLLWSLTWPKLLSLVVLSTLLVYAFYWLMVPMAVTWAGVAWGISHGLMDKILEHVSERMATLSQEKAG